MGHPLIEQAPKLDATPASGVSRKAGTSGGGDEDSPPALRLSTARVSTHLALLSLGIALPLLIMAVVLVNAMIDAQRQSMRASLDSSSKLLATLTGSELETSMTLVAALARSEALKDGDLDQFRQEASLRLRFLPQTWINVSTPDGRLLMSTRAAADLARVPDVDAGTRARAIASGRPEVSDLIGSPSADEPPNAFVCSPVSAGDSAVPYVISVAVRPERLASIIADKFEPGVLVGILDRNHRFVARIPDHANRVGTLASEGWRSAKDKASAGLLAVHSLEGEETLLSYRPTQYGWSVGVAYNRETVEAPHVFVRRTMWTIGTLLILAGGLATFLLSRRITRPARQLLEAASCLADMRPVKAVPTGVAEFDQVIHHFSQVAGMLNARDLALRGSEQHFRTALEAAESGTWTWDTRTDLRTVDARNRAMMGWQPDENVDTPKMLAQIHPDDRETVRVAMQRAIDPKGNGLFRVEYRIRTPAGEEHWIISQARAQFSEDGSAQLVGIVRDITHRKVAEQKIRFLMQEAVHRSKNLLAVVQAIANRTARIGDPQTFLPRFIDRIEGLSASQDLLIASEWGSVGLAALVDAHLAGHSDLVGTRITVRGPPLLLKPEAVQSIGMALHELATNATKYGALSTAGGKVEITWRLALEKSPPRFVIEWRESGGPPSCEPGPERRGFGQIVIGRMVETALKGKAELHFLDDGFYWRLEADPALTLDPGLMQDITVEARAVAGRS